MKNSSVTKQRRRNELRTATCLFHGNINFVTRNSTATLCRCYFVLVTNHRGCWITTRMQVTLVRKPNLWSKIAAPLFIFFIVSQLPRAKWILRIFRDDIRHLSSNILYTGSWIYAVNYHAIYIDFMRDLDLRGEKICFPTSFKII